MKIHTHNKNHDGSRSAVCRWMLSLRMLVAAAMVVAVSAVCRAQKNAYGINDRLYAQYNEAYRLRSLPEGLHKAQAMLREAERMGDGKAQCLALSVIMFYYYYQPDDEPNFRRAVKDMQDRALKTGYRQYYYFGTTNIVTWLLLRKRNYEAMEYVEQFLEETRKDGDMFGLYSGLNSLAQVYIARLESGMAVSTLNEAVEIGKKYLPDQDLTTTYRKIADCYSNIFEYRKMLNVATIGYRTARTTTNRLRLLYYMAFAAIKLHEYDKVREYCAEYIKIKGPENVNHNRAMIEFHDVGILLMQDLVKGDYRLAKKLLDATSDIKGYGVSLIRLKMSYCEMTGDAKGLSELKKQYYHILFQQRDEARSQEMKDINAMFFNRKLEMENQTLMLERQHAENDHRRAEIDNNKLSIANTQLQLHNSDLELQRTRATADILRLSVANKNLEAKRLKSGLASTRLQHEASRIKQWTMLTVFCVLLVSGLMLVRVHRRVMRYLRVIHHRLAVNNERLREARNHAVAADNAKTRVLENLTDDINIPLNSVVGFARILADGDRLTPDERREYFRQIRTNTDQLLDIVGSALEKGARSE